MKVGPNMIEVIIYHNCIEIQYGKNIRYHKSFTLLLKIRQPVAVPFHCFYNLHNCVDSQPDEIDQKQGPEYIYLEHLEVAADQTQCYGQGRPLPQLDLAQLS